MVPNCCFAEFAVGLSRLLGLGERPLAGFGCAAAWLLLAKVRRLDVPFPSRLAVTGSVVLVFHRVVDWAEFVLD